jgi:hypothetical protein
LSGAAHELAAECAKSAATVGAAVDSSGITGTAGSPAARSWPPWSSRKGGTLIVDYASQLTFIQPALLCENSGAPVRAGGVSDSAARSCGEHDRVRRSYLSWSRSDNVDRRRVRRGRPVGVLADDDDRVGPRGQRG